MKLFHVFHLDVTVKNVHLYIHIGRERRERRKRYCFHTYSRPRRYIRRVALARLRKKGFATRFFASRSETILFVLDFFFLAPYDVSARCFSEETPIHFLHKHTHTCEFIRVYIVHTYVRTIISFKILFFSPRLSTTSAPRFIYSGGGLHTRV